MFLSFYICRKHKPFQESLLWNVSSKDGLAHFKIPMWQIQQTCFEGHLSAWSIHLLIFSLVFSPNIYCHIHVYYKGGENQKAEEFEWIADFDANPGVLLLPSLLFLSPTTRRGFRLKDKDRLKTLIRQYDMHLRLHLKTLDKLSDSSRRQTSDISEKLKKIVM